MERSESPWGTGHMSEGYQLSAARVALPGAEHLLKGSSCFASSNKTWWGKGHLEWRDQVSSENGSY